MKLSSEQVKQLIPHREPFLLVDEATSVNIGQDLSATWFVSPDLELFAGHFPGNPVVPGAYLVEAMAQAAALLLMTDEQNSGKLPLLFSLDKVRFLRQGKPGDIITLTAKILQNAGDGLYDCKVSASTEDGRLAMGVMTLALR